MRVEFRGQIEDYRVDSVTGEILGYRSHLSVFPASHYATPVINLRRRFRPYPRNWKKGLKRGQDKLLEAQRLNSGPSTTNAC